MTKFTTRQRKNLTKKNMAMPDGSYPIRNRSDLRNAIASYGRAKNKPAVKKWIISRAKSLDSEDLIPESWKDDIRQVTKSMKISDDSEYLTHYGVLGMKWGIRRSEKYASKSDKYKKKASKFREQRLNKSSKYDLKAAKYNKKAAKYQTKVVKAQRKGDQSAYVKNQTKQAKYADKAAKYSKKSTRIKSLEAKYTYKGEKFLEKSKKLKVKYSSI